MEKFCGAFDVSGKGVDFSLLHCMNGSKSCGGAYVNGELGIVCGINNISPDSIQPITMEIDGNIYTVALLSDTENGVELARDMLLGYVSDGAEYFFRSEECFELVLYDSRRAELYLCRSETSHSPVFLMEQDTTVYFFTSLSAIYKLCESVGINRERWNKYLRSQRIEDAHKMFCGIEAIPAGEGALYTRFGRSNIIFNGDLEYSSEIYLKEVCSKDIREMMTALIFKNGYPYPFEAPRERRELKKLERAFDEYFDELMISLRRRKIYTLAENEHLHLSKEKSMPRRVIAKGMLCQTLIWAEHFNIYFV